MNVSRPNVTQNIIPAEAPAKNQDQKVLIVGQQLAAATATSGDLIQDHPDDGTENALFGQRSHLAGMVREFKKLNKRSRIDIIPLDDGSGTQATAIFAITGPATEDGTLRFTLGSDKNHFYDVDITSGDSATDIGDALDVLTAADGDAPFTTANVTGTVTATAEHDGTLANSYDIKVSGTVAGVAVVLTGWTGGATDPSLTTLFDPITNIRYQTIVYPSSWDITVVETELDGRFNLSNDIKDGVAIQIVKGTSTSLKATVASLNSQSLVVAGNKTVSKATHIGSATPEMPDVIAAQIGAIRALRLTDEAPLTQFLTTTAPTDQFGGRHISTLPYFNTALPNLPIASADDFWTQTEIEDLSDNAVAVFGPNKAFNTTIFGDMVTTYLTDTAGNPDESYKFLNSVDSSSTARETFVNNYNSRYAQTRLTDGDLIAELDMANEGSIRAFAEEIYDDLSDDGITQKGRTAKKDFRANLSVTVSVAAGSATINSAPLQVGQFRVILGTIQVNFGG